MIPIKGRIVIYTIVGCPHCRQAKSTLREQNLPFIDICVDHYHNVREWLRVNLTLFLFILLFFLLFIYSF